MCPSCCSFLVKGSLGNQRSVLRQCSGLDGMGANAGRRVQGQPAGWASSELAQLRSSALASLCHRECHQNMYLLLAQEARIVKVTCRQGRGAKPHCATIPGLLHKATVSRQQSLLCFRLSPRPLSQHQLQNSCSWFPST